MNITAAQVKDIKTEFAKLKPVKVTLDGNRSLTVKEAVFALAPTLERMKRRGFYRTARIRPPRPEPISWCGRFRKPSNIRP